MRRIQPSFLAENPGILRDLKLVRSRLDRALMHGWQTTELSPSSRPKVIVAEFDKEDTRPEGFPEARESAGVMPRETEIKADPSP
jgi:hypothetical protein